MIILESASTKKLMVDVWRAIRTIERVMSRPSRTPFASSKQSRRRNSRACREISLTDEPIFDNSEEDAGILHKVSLRHLFEPPMSTRSKTSDLHV